MQLVRGAAHFTLQEEGRWRGWRRPSWCGLVCVCGGGLPARRFGHRLCPLPASPSLPPCSPSPLAGSSGGTLWAAGACLGCRLPAGALTDESLLPPWGPAREGEEGGLDSGFRGLGFLQPAEPHPHISSATAQSLERQGTDNLSPPVRSQEGGVPIPASPLTDLERTLGPLPG